MDAAWWRGVAVGVLLAGGSVLTGCGGDEAASEAPTSVSGVVLDGPEGAPVGDAEVELLVYPAAMGSRGDDDAASTAGTGSTGSDGAYALEADVDELTPHAGADGRVQVEVRVVGSEAGTRTTVLLRKDQETGETQVVETTGVVVEAG